MKKSKPSVIPFLIVAAIGAATLLFAPAHAHASEVPGVSHPDLNEGGGDMSGDPDQPDPTRSSSIARGAQPRIGTGAPRMYVDSNPGSVVASPVGRFSSRGWLEAMMWSLRARIGW